MSQNQQIKMTIWFVACLIASGALSLPSSAVELANQSSSSNGTQQNVTSTSLMTKQSPVSRESMNNSTTRTRRALVSGVESVSVPAKILLSSAPSRSSSVASSMMGDSVGLETALRANGDLTPAAGEHKKYVLVKKKPKHKKIKMEVYKPKMKYKKIKIKVPVKKMKKKKVKGYLVKKEKHHHHY